MAANTSGVIRLTKIRGRNRFDAPLAIPDDMVYDAINVESWKNTLGEKRQGSSAVSVSFSAGGPFSGSIGSLLRHIPGDDETAAELWATDLGAAGRIARMAGATTFADVTLKDNLSSASDAANVLGASYPNGFFFLAYKSGNNRLHVWDPTLSKVRRVGIATPNTPTGLADGGTGLTFTRYYRVRDVDVSGSDVRRRSEASAVLGPLSIANKSGITVTKGAATNEDETHWELEASDNATGPWYRIARTVIGTTTFDDTNATIPTTNISASDGINYPPPAAKFILATDARIIMANSWETSGGFVTPKSNRVWFTPVVGDNDVGDLERIPTGRYLDVDASITALAGPLQGVIYVFSYRRIWKLVPTGDSTAPYVKYSVSDSVGCIRQQSVVAADDEQGNHCLYFMSQRGPYRLGQNGLQYLGADSIDQWTKLVPADCFSLFHADKRQVWLSFGTGSDTHATGRIRFDIALGQTQPNGDVRGGHFLDNTTGSQSAYAAVMFANTLGASMSRDLKPYYAQAGGTGRIWKADADGVYTEGGSSAYSGAITTKEYAPFGATQMFITNDAYLVLVGDGNADRFYVKAGSDFGVFNSVTVDATAILNWTATLAGNRLHEIAAISGVGAVGSMAYQLGDGLGAGGDETYWRLEAFEVPYTQGGSF